MIVILNHILNKARRMQSTIIVLVLTFVVAVTVDGNRGNRGHPNFPFKQCPAVRDIENGEIITIEENKEVEFRCDEGYKLVVKAVCGSFLLGPWRRWNLSVECELDSCETNPCLNGGVCIPEPNGVGDPFTCMCMAGDVGRICDENK